MNDTTILEPEQAPPNALESYHRAEIDLQIATAKRYPRQLGLIKQKMIGLAGLDQETAESCFYSLPRGGKNIQGPSVRLAEIAVGCYGHLRVGSRVVSTVTTGDNPHVVIQAVCHDLENNVAVTMEKRRRITKKKFKDSIDDDDINLACNSGAAIAFRDAVFKVVPGVLIKAAYDHAKKTAIGDAKTLVDRRARMVEAFGKMGVSKEMIFARLEKKTMDDIDLSDLETLIGLHTAIKEGDTTIEESFAPKVEKPAFNTTAPAAAPKAEPANIAPMPTTPAPAPTPAPASPNGNPVPAPTPAPAPTPTPEPEPAKEAPARAKAKPPAKAGAKQKLIEANVPFDDFTDWCVTTGRHPKAKDWPSYDTVPDSFWTALNLDEVGVGKCVILYGKPAEDLAPAPVV